MPFNPTRLKFDIQSSKPTKLTMTNLRTQLNALNFKCEHTLEPALEKYISEGMAKVPEGKSFLVAILSPKKSVERRVGALSSVKDSPIKSVNDIAFADNTIKLKSHDGSIEEYYLERVNGSFCFPNAQDMPRILNTADVSTWKPSYLRFEKLSIIMKGDNFDKLRTDDFNNFKARSGSETLTESINKTDVDTIKELLAKLVTNTSSRVLFGLTKDDVLPILINRLGLMDTSGDKFEIKDSMITIWANNPTSGGEVDALGAVNSNWVISGKNDSGSDSKKNGRSPVHETNFSVTTRSVIYSEDDFLEGDYKYLIGK